MLIRNFLIRRYLALALLACGLVLTAPLGRAQGIQLTATELELVMDSTNLARKLLSVNKADENARALVIFGKTLDPTYQPIKDLVAEAEGSTAVAPPRVSPTMAEIVNKFLAAASKERDPNRQLLYNLMAFQLDRENVTAQAALVVAKNKGMPLSLGKAFEMNKRMVLSVDLDYVGTLQPLYEMVTDEILENGADTRMQMLADADDIFKDRARADEADDELADDARRLIKLMAGLILKRQESMERLERAKNYEPSDLVSTKMYDEEKRRGRDTQMKNAYNDWKQKLKDGRPPVDRLMAQIMRQERDLDRKYRAQMQVATTSGPPVGSGPPTGNGRDPFGDDPVFSDDTFQDNPPRRHDPPVDTQSNPDDWGGGEEDKSWEVVTGDGGNKTVDAARLKTPEHLRNQVKEMAMWLEAQRGRTGKIADKIFAEDTGDGRVVLYLQVSKLFQAQDKETRFALTKSVQQFWARRVVTADKVRGFDAAFLYTMDENSKIVGGSQERRGSSIWVVDKL